MLGKIDVLIQGNTTNYRKKLFFHGELFSMSVSIEMSLVPLDCEQRIRAHVGNAVPVLSARLFRQFSAPWLVILPSPAVSRNISLPDL
jgi:hypothetical protein